MFLLIFTLTDREGESRHETHYYECTYFMKSSIPGGNQTTSATLSLVLTLSLGLSQEITTSLMSSVNIVTVNKFLVVRKNYSVN